MGRYLIIAIMLATGVCPASAATDSLGKTYLSFDGPIGKTGVAGAPTLKAITAKYNVTFRNGLSVDIAPEFHFISPLGNAKILHRQLVETDSAITPSDIRDATINTPVEEQISGATIVGGWPCGSGHYHVTLKAWIEDVNGNSGNTLQYTIHCHELVMF